MELNDQLVRAFSKVGIRDEWMPDPAIYRFVYECLAYWHGKDPHHFPYHPDQMPAWWIPISIVGTLDWVVITTWWLWKNTGFLNTRDPMDWIYRYVMDGGGVYEFPPQDLMEFLNDRNARSERFEERASSPGVDDRERASLITWLRNHNYPSWGLDSPPQFAVEQLSWATLIWLISNNADDFYRQLDAMFIQLLDRGHLLQDTPAGPTCVHCQMSAGQALVEDCPANKQAHLGRFGGEHSQSQETELLDEMRLTKTSRMAGTCASCEVSAWCVRAEIANEHSSQLYLCRSCFAKALLEQEITMNLEPGTEDDCFTCRNLACKNHPVGEKEFWDAAAEKGEENLAEWNRLVAANGGLNPRIANGDAEGTIGRLIEYFRGNQLEG